MNKKELKKMQDEINSHPLDDFLGLSPEQMYQMIYFSPETFEHILYIKPDFDKELLSKVPILDDLLLLFRLLAEAGEVRVTKKGNLPVKIVNEIYNKQRADKKPSGFLYNSQSEEYASDILAARVSATACGWIQFEKNKFSLSNQGKSILENGFSQKDFVRLLDYFVFHCHWSYLHGWEHCHIVQQAVVFELYVLNKKARDTYLDLKTFSQLFLKAFPFAPEEVDDDYCEDSYRPRIVTSVLEQRFINSFCERFGLIKLSEKSEYEDDFGFNDSFQITKLYDELFIWFSPDKQKFRSMSQSMAKH